MQSTSSSVQKYIIPLGILLCSAGITINVLNLTAVLTIKDWQWQWLLPFQFSIPLFDELKSAIPWWSIIFYLMMATGTWHYYKSGSDQSGLLRFSFSFIVYTTFVLILTCIFLPIIHLSKLETMTSFRWSVLLMLIYYVILFKVAKKIVLYLDAELKNKYYQEPVGGSEDLIRVESSLKNRLQHFIIDFLIMVATISPLYTLVIFFTRIHHIEISPVMQLIGMVLSLYFTYHLLQEFNFRSTPAKYLTGSRLVMANNENELNFYAILRRTICRFIPFDALSFLNRHNWHDRFSHTLVVKEPFSQSGKTYGVLWAILFIAAPIVQEVYTTLHTHSQEKEVQNFEERIEQSRREELVSHLSTDHLVLYSYADKSWGSVYVFKIDSIGTDSVWGYSFKEKANIVDYPHLLNEAHMTVKEKIIKGIAKKDFIPFIKDEPSKLFQNEEPWQIMDMFLINQPHFEYGQRKTYHQRKKDAELSVYWSISLAFVPLTLVEILTLEGNIIWTNQLPKKIELHESMKLGYITLTADNQKETTPFKVILTLIDQTGKEYQLFAENTAAGFRFYQKF